MAKTGKSSFQQVLQDLYDLVQNGDPTALSKILTVLKKVPEEPNLLHLAGIACTRIGDHSDAMTYLSRSLAANANQPEVLNNLANVHLALGANAEAETCYRSAAELKPDYQDAWKNLGLLLTNLGRYPEAEAALLRAREIDVGSASVLTALGNLYKEQDLFDQAADFYHKALVAEPGYVNALHNLGLCYKQTERLDQAIDCYRRARALAPQLAEIDFNLGNAFFEQGDHVRAETSYRDAIRKNPTFVLAHQTLSELYWQLGQVDRADDSYREALKVAPSHIGLRLSWVNLLIAAGRGDEAQVVIAETLAMETNPALLHARGKLEADANRFSEARDSFEQSLDRMFTVPAAQDLIKLHIVQGNYAAVQALVERAQQQSPDDQLTWALQGLTWRLLGDDRYHWLIDYDRMIGVFTLPTPSGYANLTAFLEDLEATLLGMHVLRSQPSRQTLKHGTQTPGRLLYKPNPVIAHYKRALTEVVTEYISSLPADNTHPFLGLRRANASTGFVFSGSWSVKLSSGGFHVNHVHPEGWISSSAYISMPKAVTSDDDAGSIKFGESPLDLGDREVIGRIIRPRAGQLVLFPSYTWHGTVPFAGSEGEYRLTAPFDVIPA